MICGGATMIKVVCRAPLCLGRDQRMAGHRRRLRQAEKVEQGRGHVAKTPVFESADRGRGLTTMNGTELSV